MPRSAFALTQSSVCAGCVGRRADDMSRTFPLYLEDRSNREQRTTYNRKTAQKQQTRNKQKEIQKRDSPTLASGCSSQLSGSTQGRFSFVDAIASQGRPAASARFRSFSNAAPTRPPPPKKKKVLYPRARSGSDAGLRLKHENQLDLPLLYPPCILELDSSDAGLRLEHENQIDLPPLYPSCILELAATQMPASDSSTRIPS